MTHHIQKVLERLIVKFTLETQIQKATKWHVESAEFKKKSSCKNSITIKAILQIWKKIKIFSYVFKKMRQCVAN